MLQFYVSYGWWGVAGAAVNLIIMPLTTMAILQYGSYFRAQTHGKVFDSITTSLVSRFMDYGLSAAQFCIGFVMLAGAGSNVNQQFGLPLWVGSALMVLMVIIAGMFNADRVGSIIGMITPAMIVVIVGAGPAGLAAAREAAASDARVVLIDEDSQLGGTLLDDRGTEIDGLRAHEWIAQVRAELEAAPETLVLERTTALGCYDGNYVVALQRRTDHLPTSPGPGVSRERTWHIRARQVVLATGAHERPVVFQDNDGPGIMLASAVRAYLNRWAVAAGQSPVIFATDDSAYELVADLAAAGVQVAGVVDARTELSEFTAQAAAVAGVEARTGSAVIGTAGDGPDGRISTVTVSSIDADGAPVGEAETLSTDLLAVAGGWSPVVHMHSQRQGRLNWDAQLSGFIPAAPVQDQQVVGMLTGTRDLAGCLSAGAEAGAEAARRTGFSVQARAIQAKAREYGPGRQLWLIPSGQPEDRWDRHFVDLQRDQTAADVLRATGAGMRSVEHVKRYTSISTANDQGKTSGVSSIGVIAAALKDPDVGGIGTTTYRAPYTPEAFAALAGRRRGQMLDATRVTAIHPWHVAHGAEFKDVGQWKRRWYYPQPGEDMEAAVLRECAAVRESVGFMDATTLGKIEIRGTDEGEFLNRIYTNAFKKLAPGKGRYGVMCHADGLVFDDGVTLRLDEKHYLMTTTTGGAADVLNWLEEWSQTEWPELDVVFTSVTEQYATVAVVGPKSKEVVARMAPELDVSQEAFGFMEFRETTLASGIPARICRISFSGELAYEINISTWYGHRVWEDTDGTVTPQDLGMSWVVSTKKDFIGNRSYAREDTSREDRKQLVAVLPVDPDEPIPEGAQLVETGTPITPKDEPVPMVGHVTSAYRSAALGRTFGLALVRNGRQRIGDTLQAPLVDRTVDVVIAEPVLYDPEGNRRDG